MRRQLAIFVSVVVFALPSIHALHWEALQCPGSTFSRQCQWQNEGKADKLVSLYYQFEGTITGGFSCTGKSTNGSEVTYCADRWNTDEQGSAHSCVFLMAADATMQCSGTGGVVNVIGAHATPLNETILSGEWHESTCPPQGPGMFKGSCTMKASQSDMWVHTAFESGDKTNGQSGMYCELTRPRTPVCSWSHTTGGGGMGSSCGFLIPAGEELSCKVTEGVLNVKSSMFTKLTKQITQSSTAGAAGNTSCPITAMPVKTTLCDCDHKNEDRTDKYVTLNAENIDGVFNSFHCYIGDVNICAWGANNKNRGEGGSCSFLLPAGETYHCEMQFGATAFSSVTVFPLGVTLFPQSQFSASHNMPQTPAEAAHLPASRSDAELRTAYVSWVQGMKSKSYLTVHDFEDSASFMNFKQHVAIADIQARRMNKTQPEKFNSLAGTSLSEFEAAYRGCSHVDASLTPTIDEELQFDRIPDSVDWTTKHVVTDVKDQGQCGSCWSFSATGAMESHWAIAGHPLVELSMQELVSCEKDCDGCNGGYPYKAIHWASVHGIDDLQSYPYSSGSGTAPRCRAGKEASINVMNYTVVPADEDKMAAYVAQYGPLSVSLDAMTQLWWPYKSGIMKGCCNKNPDHAVLIVGYGEENGEKYWLIKNSWGPGWGEEGYIRLARGTNECGITTQPIGVSVGKPRPTPPGPPAPPPTPPPPPAPPGPPGPPGKCPTDATPTNRPTGCMWINGTRSVTMPPGAVIGEYCDYIADGYFGYTFPSTLDPNEPFKYPCPPSASRSQNLRKRSGSDALLSETFCIWESSEKGVTFPKQATANCTLLGQGYIGFAV